MVGNTANYILTILKFDMKGYLLAHLSSNMMTDRFNPASKRIPRNSVENRSNHVLMCLHVWQPFHFQTKQSHCILFIFTGGQSTY